ncbi:hypothetical protein WN943_016105 [Citrus x changshan-huyou]
MKVLSRLCITSFCSPSCSPSPQRLEPVDRNRKPFPARNNTEMRLVSPGFKLWLLNQSKADTEVVCSYVFQVFRKILPAPYTY